MIYENFIDVPYSEWAKGGDIKIRNIESIPVELQNQQAIGVMPPEAKAWWFWLLFKIIAYGVIFTAVWRLTIHATYVVVRSAPEGRKEILSDGSIIYTAPDGSTYLYDPETGFLTPLGGPTEFDIAKILGYVVVLVVVVVSIYVVFKFVIPSFKEKKKEKSTES